MTRISWTRHKATTQGRQATAAASDNWHRLLRINAEFEAERREMERKARLRDRAVLKKQRDIGRLKRLWARVKEHEFDL